MKFIATTSAAALIAATSMAHAGGMAEPIMTMEPAMVLEESASSSSGLLVPLIIIALLAAAASNSGVEDPFPEVSDARVKTDIVPVGVAPNGLNIYQYRYIGSSTVFEGVMAQEVLMHTPDAVVTYPSGMMAVNYDMLGMTLNVVD